MGKRRNAENKFYTGGEGNTTSSKSYGGGCRDNGKFSVFEFADDDLRVETESRKTLAKFGTKSPGKKSAHHRRPVDKYTFLEFFSASGLETSDRKVIDETSEVAQGITAQQKDSGSDVLDVDVTDSDFQDRTFGTDITISPRSLNYDSRRCPFLKHQGVECSSCGAKSSPPGSRKPIGYTTGRKHNQILYVDSDEDGGMVLRSSSSSFDLAENEGSLEEQSSEYGAKDNDCSKADVVNLHLKSKDINVAEAGDWTSGSLELEFVVLDDPQWSEKLEEIKSLDLKYKAAWKTIISECNFDEAFEDIVYPDGDPDAVFISRRDIELLQPRTFINDTIIDFYIKYLVNKTKPEKQHMFHFFNTFFFRKLVDMDRDSSKTWEGSDAFQRVQKGMDGSSKVPCILHMDSIKGSHGGLENLIRSYLWEEWKERGNKEEEEISMKFLNLDFVALQLEDLTSSVFCGMNDITFQCSSIESGDISLEIGDAGLPQQENLFDCGLFLLHYAELFLEHASNGSATKYVDFKSPDSDQVESVIHSEMIMSNVVSFFPLMIVALVSIWIQLVVVFVAVAALSKGRSNRQIILLNKDWFLAAEVSLKKRDHIRKLIHRIVKENVLKDPPAARHNEYLQSGRNEGDSRPNFVQPDGVEEPHLNDIKFNSSYEFEIKGRQSFSAMLEQRNIDNSVLDESFGHYNLLVPINQFNNMTLPMEVIISMLIGKVFVMYYAFKQTNHFPIVIYLKQDAIGNQATFPPGDTSSRFESDRDNKPMPPLYPFSSFRTREMRVSHETSSSKSPIIIDVQNEDDCVPEVASPTKRRKDKNENSSLSSEDFSACVVEDSEEESDRESIRKTRRSSFLISPTGLIL
ncbi:hypothetical protein DH2020_030005 [Rehmannia glutinosa]|uniref:Ubiquitin-like protease family profile domain-containing protein n=1 Tax=Rehmannia glutinosa TaxID=99300 RepID=A0ABR0VQG3_REHGL